MNARHFNDTPTRRDFLRASVGLSATLIFGGFSSSSPSTSSGGPLEDVRTHGARGDAFNDDTGAFQQAIDALPASGGTVRVPQGDYRVDATRSIRLRSGTRLRLEPNARLVAIANDRRRSCVLFVEDVRDVVISGGKIIGEREGHLGSHGEWGYGISIRGATRVAVSDIHVSDCWGDGVCVGGFAMKGGQMRASEDVTLARVTCTGNRRQGITIGPARRVRVIECVITNTSGTKPECGIDIEPDPPSSAEYIEIVDCTLTDNGGSGIQVYKNVSRVTIHRCTIERNSGYGILVVGADKGSISDNAISHNGLTGTMLRTGARGFEIRANTFRNNATHRLRNMLGDVRRGWVLRPATDYRNDIRVMDDAESITLAGNTFER